jgi:hypothetical protein
MVEHYPSPALDCAIPLKRGSRIALFLASGFFGAAGASILILKFAPAPFFWMFATWAAAFFLAMFAVPGSWTRAILLNLGLVLCILAGTEGYVFTHEYTPPITPDGFWAHDEALGWAPTQGTKFHVFKSNPAGLFHHPEGLLFDQTYTIGPDGLRIAPPWRKDDLAGTILFFGCSFTFGEGLKDDETLPYQVGMQSEGRYRTFNFAFEGYGPAQMLANIEDGRVRRTVDTPPRYAYYVMIPSHVWRVAGRVGWGNHAPRYELAADGTVHQTGHFENRKTLAQRLGLKRGLGQLNKSAIWRMLSLPDLRINDDDIRLCLAVVRRSQELLEAQYPGLQFRVILWSNQDAPQQRYAYEKLRDGIRNMGIPLDLVENILPGYNVDRSPYMLGPSDHHPDALADRLLAHQILTEIH